MNFVDEATIKVEAGKGGNGCLSFRREKYIERGGPDGGDGGRGGSVLLVGDASLNTLVDFRYQPNYKAQKGGGGKGSDRTGAKGEDLYVRVPCGTSLFDEETDAYLGDVNSDGETLLVASGGRHGLGNVRFKSSTNRAPRQTTKGELGESKQIRLELKLLADVGLLGLPNSGKSTLVSVVSAAKPKIADYPFTTLVPSLGVVRLSHDKSFVIADIPGLIEGAAEGAGLGVQFLKHLSRTRLLLHLIDVAPFEGGDPLKNCRTIEDELACYSEGIANKTRWVVFTKSDLLYEDEKQELSGLAKQLGADRHFTISAVANEGTESLMRAVAEFLAELDSVDDDERILRETHEYSLRKRQERWQKRIGALGDDREGREDEFDVSVHYEQ